MKNLPVVRLSEREQESGGLAQIVAQRLARQDVQAVVDLFQARIDMGASITNYPESAAGWQKFAQVQKSGNFVCMIVLPEGYVIPENVFAQ